MSTVATLALLGACGGQQEPVEPDGGASSFLTGNEDAHYSAGIQAIHAGDIAGAAAEFESALRENPRYLAAHLALGDVRFRQGNYPGALSSFNDALALRERTVDGHLGVAKAHAAMGAWEASELAARRAIELANEMDSRTVRATALEVLGQAQQGQGDSAGAIASLEASLSDEAGRHSARTRLARQYLAVGNSEATVRLLTRGENYLTGAEDRLLYALVYMEMHSYDRALPLLTTAHELRAGDRSIALSYALASMRGGAPGAGIAVVSPWIDDSLAPDALTIRAEGLFALDQIDAAERDLGPALSVASPSYDALLLDAMIGAQVGDDQRAQRQFEAALALRSRDRRGVTTAAEYFTAHGDHAAVERVLAPVANLSPQPDRWLALRSHALGELGREDESIALLSHYARSRRNDAALQLEVAQRAVIAETAVSAEDALWHARAAIEAVGGAPLTYRLTLMDALMLNELRDEARDVLHIALEVFPGSIELEARRERLH